MEQIQHENGLLNGIIRFSLNNRVAVLVIAFICLVAGIYSTIHTEVDVFPDLNAPTVVVMTEAEGMLETGYGMIVSGWKLEDGDFHYHCEIPCGTEALLTLPDGKKTLLKSGTFEFSTPYACPIL